MQYRMLTDQDQIDLLRERVTYLEAEHFRALLVSFEVDGEALATEQRKMAALEKRIERHLGPPDDPPAGEPGESTTDRSDDESTATPDTSASLDQVTTSSPGG